MSAISSLAVSPGGCFPARIAARISGARKASRQFLRRSPWLYAQRQRRSATLRSRSGRGRRTPRRSVYAGRRPNCPSAAAPSSSRSIASQLRGECDGREGAVDRCAPVLATLQADVVAAMAKAGQRGSCGMGQPPRSWQQCRLPNALACQATRTLQPQGARSPMTEAVAVTPRWPRREPHVLHAEEITDRRLALGHAVEVAHSASM